MWDTHCNTVNKWLDNNEVVVAIIQTCKTIAYYFMTQINEDVIASLTFSVPAMKPRFYNKHVKIRFLKSQHIKRIVYSELLVQKYIARHLAISYKER